MKLELKNIPLEHMSVGDGEMPSDTTPLACDYIPLSDYSNDPWEQLDTMIVPEKFQTSSETEQANGDPQENDEEKGESKED